MLTKRKNPIEILKALNDFVTEDPETVDTMSKDEVSARLKKENIDTSQLIADVQKLIRKMQAQSELDAANNERNVLLEKFRDAKSQKPAGIRDKIKELIDSLSITGQELALYYRKYESTNDEDLDGLYNDLKILKEMKEHGSEKQSKPE